MSQSPLYLGKFAPSTGTGGGSGGGGGTTLYPTDWISTDPNNALTIGADGKMFLTLSSGPVPDPITPEDWISDDPDNQITLGSDGKMFLKINIPEQDLGNVARTILKSGYLYKVISNPRQLIPNEQQAVMFRGISTLYSTIFPTAIGGGEPEVLSDIEPNSTWGGGDVVNSQLGMGWAYLGFVGPGDCCLVGLEVEEISLDSDPLATVIDDLDAKGGWDKIGEEIIQAGPGQFDSDFQEVKDFSFDPNYDLQETELDDFDPELDFQEIVV